jgi:plasmid replication initiation protein
MLPSDYLKSISTPGVKTSNLVKISNSLIESFIKKNNLTTLKILFYISRSCDSVVKNGDLVNLRLNIKDLLSYTNIDINTFKRNLSVIQKTLITFVSTSEGEARYVENVSVIPYSKIEYGGFLELKLFTNIYNLIVDVKNKFTVIDLDNLMKLNSKHSCRMIQLLEYIEGFSSNIPKRKVYSLLEFNLMFDTNYKNFYELERKILIPVKSELDEFSSLTFLYSFNYDKVLKSSAGRPRAVSVVLDLKSNRTRQMKLF